MAKRKPKKRRTRPAAEAPRRPAEPAPLPKRPGPPPPLWGNVPLTQLAVLAGLILLVLGAVGGDPKKVVIGLALGSLGGLEQAGREHLTGYRSHTLLLSGLCFVVATGLVFFSTKLVLAVCLLIGLAVFAPAFWLLRQRFIKASGGLSYRVR